MALQNTDLFVVYRPATEVSYKLQASTFQPAISDGTAEGQLLAWDGDKWVPAAVGTATGQLLAWNGTDWVPAESPTEAGQMLEWSGTEWTPSSVIDGGEYF